MLRRALAILFVCGGLSLLGLWGGRLILKSRERARSDSCLSHVKLIMLSMRAYALDQDGRWPNALTWPEAVMTYQGPSQRRPLRPYVLECLQEQPPPGSRPYARDRISYAMLQSRSHERLATDQDLFSLIVLFEIGKFGPAYDRHNNGMNIGHADGHAKWYRRDRMTPDVILSGSVPAPPAP